MSTDEKNRSRAVLGQAKLALRFQIPSQASLHGIVQTHRPLAPRVALLFRALREIKKCQELASRKKHGARPACRDGGVFEKISASLLVRGFAKRPHHSRSE